MFELRYKKIGAIIAYYRKINGWTQMDLAGKIGFSVSYLSQIERGVSTEGVPLSTYMRIADALGVELNDILDVVNKTK